jgi:HEAT repeat protein
MNARRQAALRRSLPVLKRVTESLRTVGYDVTALSELPVLEDGDPVIAVLVDWMTRLDNEAVKEGIARALTFRSADAELARFLVAQFESAPPDSLLQWTVGNAIGAMAQVVVVDDLIRLVSVSEYGEARGQLVRALAGFGGDQRVEATILELLSDESVAIEAIETAGRLRLADAVDPIRAWLDTGDEVVTETARQALARIARS